MRFANTVKYVLAFYDQDQALTGRKSRNITRSTRTSSGVSCHCRFVAKLMAVRLNIRSLSADYDKTEDDMKALQSVGLIIGEVLKQLDEERCGLTVVHVP